MNKHRILASIAYAIVGLFVFKVVALKSNIPALQRIAAFL